MTIYGLNDGLGYDKEFVGTGSPTTWGKPIQAGASALGAGSNVWLTFGTAFETTPTCIVLTTINGGTAGNNDLQAGSITAGSCYVEGKTASEAFYWIAL